MTDKQKPAVTVREPGVTISGIGITRQVRVGFNPAHPKNYADGDSDVIAFEAAIDATTTIDDLMDRLELMDDAIRRQRAKSELPIAREGLEIARRQPRQLEEHLDELNRQKMALQAKFHNLHEIRGKRTEWRPNDTQKTAIAEIDSHIESTQKSLAEVSGHVAGAEWQVARREAIIRGEPEPPAPDGMLNIASKITATRPQAAD
jgi:hypothetical protein